ELKKIRLSIIVFLIFNIYIIFSWWCWWYGGALGQRSMIDSYAIMAIPLTSLIAFTIEKKVYYRVLLYPVFIFFIWLNIFQTFQIERGVLHWDGMTRKLYFKQFGKLERINYYDNYISYTDAKE